MNLPTAEIAYGYTIADLHRMASAACLADRSMASDARTRYDVAWSAIAEHMVTMKTRRPTREDLIRVGWQAIYNEVREMRHTFGFRDKAGTNGVASSPRFVSYWTHLHESPQDDRIDRMALAQILPTLRPTEMEAVTALAVTDDYAAAAASLGINYNAFTVRMTAARRRFRSHWFAPDSAPPVKGTDRRVGSYTRAPRSVCRAGHEMTPENTYNRPGRRGERRCKACEHDRSLTRSAAKTAARKAARIADDLTEEGTAA